MEIEPAANQRIKENVRTTMQKSGGAETDDVALELRSHLFEAAQRHAVAKRHPRIELEDVDAAVHELGTPSEVAKELGRRNRWMPRLPPGRRSVAAIALALGSAFLGFAYVLVGALCWFSRPTGVEGFETCTAGVSAWAGFFVAATMAGAVGVWFAMRWVPIVAATFLALLPLMSVGGDWFFGLLCAMLFVGSAIIMPTRLDIARTGESRMWMYLLFAPIGLVAAIFVNLVVQDLLGIRLEGGQAFLGTLFVIVLSMWGLTLALLRRRDPGFAAGSLAIVVLTTFVGFAVYFAASFAGSGCFSRGPATASWTDEAMFEQFPDSGRYGHLSVTRSEPAEGLPFVTSDLNARYGADNYSLTDITWVANSEASNHGETMLQLLPGPRLGFSWTTLTSDGDARGMVTRFLANATSASPQESTDIADALFASRTTRGHAYTADPSSGAPPVQMFHSETNIFVPLRTEERWQSQQSTPEDPRTPHEWSFGFSYSRYDAVGTIDSKRVKLGVAADGTATFQVDDSSVPTDEEWTRIVSTAFADLGLEYPTDTLSPQTQTICVD